MQFAGSIATVLGLGFLYFISAIPAGIALHLSPWLCALSAWIGYSLGGLLIALLGEPARRFLMGKLKIEPKSGEPNLIQRAWKRFGLPALGLLAPVTIGPQGAALLGIALGVPKGPLVMAISLGVVPWCIGFTILARFGLKLGAS